MKAKKQIIAVGGGGFTHNEDKDLGTLGETELLSKTNNELKEYLKRTGKSTTGNKEQLVKNILGV